MNISQENCIIDTSKKILFFFNGGKKGKKMISLVINKFDDVHSPKE
jgi:hypothetical protein